MCVYTLQASKVRCLMHAAAEKGPRRRSRHSARAWVTQPLVIAGRSSAAAVWTPDAKFSTGHNGWRHALLRPAAEDVRAVGVVPLARV